MADLQAELDQVSAQVADLDAQIVAKNKTLAKSTATAKGQLRELYAVRDPLRQREMQLLSEVGGRPATVLGHDQETG